MKNMKDTFAVVWWRQSKHICLERKVSVKTNYLLLSYYKPHRAVSKATISRWIHGVMNMSWKDTNVFGAHSKRGAASSAAASSAVPMEIILITALDGPMRTHSQHFIKGMLLYRTMVPLSTQPYKVALSLKINFWQRVGLLWLSEMALKSQCGLRPKWIWSRILQLSQTYL